MWKKLHNPIFHISEQNITVHALQENCNNKKKRKKPNTHTKKKNLN